MTPPAARAFLSQQFERETTSKPISSFTAIMGAFSAAFHVLTRRAAGNRCSSAARFATFMAKPRPCPRCSRMTNVSCCQTDSGAPSGTAISVNPASLPESSWPGPP